MSSKHLGDSVNDLLDGRLRGERAYAAMAHLAECADCASRFHSAKAARDALQSSPCGIDMRFARSLLDQDRIAEIASREDSRLAKATKPRSTKPALAAVSVVVVATVIITAAWVTGAPDEVSLEFAQASGGNARPVSYVDPQGMRSGESLRSWIHPDFSQTDLIPIEATVVERPAGHLALVATIQADLETITVTQIHGSLPEVFTQGTVTEAVGDLDVFVLGSGETSTLVWQTGDTVIAIGCECALSTLTDVAAQFPTGQEPSFVDRVSDGFDEWAEALDH